MPKAKRHKALRIALLTFLCIIAAIGCYGLWLSQHYRNILVRRIPEMVAKSSDSLYHVTFKDIKVNVFRRWVVISGVHLWADTNQANIFRKRGHYSPNTVSFLIAPRVEVYGIKWDNILSSHSFDCNQLVIRNPKWFMLTVKHDPDMTDIETEKKSSLVTRMGVDHFTIVDPSVTYHYVGLHGNTYYCYLKGGQADLYDWSVDRDIHKDTSVFLYGRHGAVRPASFTFAKDGRRYEVREPVISFTSTPTGITLHEVKIMHLVDIDDNTGRNMEVYNLRFPALEFENFNWKRLLHDDQLVSSRVNAAKPYIEVHYQRSYFPKDQDKIGSFPNQLIHEFIPLYVKTLNVKGGTIVYNEPGKNDEAVFQFDDIGGSFNNITNLKDRLDQNGNCTIKLEGKFMHKSPVGADFDLSLTDPHGHFSLAGYVSNLDGEEVTKQASEFTFAKVTAFHLSHMEGRVEGNESAASGHFTMLYTDLKLSLLSDGDHPKDKKGPLALLADKLILYPSNPMPGEGVRSVSTSIRRDAGHGLIYLIWQNAYLGAQKTAVRSDKFISLAGGKTGDDPKPKKNGFFHRLFHWKK